MSSDHPASRPPQPGAAVGAPLPVAVRQRLQAIFDRAQQCVERADHDYANDLFTQCVVEDPGNLIYLQEFLANLAKKYGGNKKGARFSTLKVKSARMSLSKAIDKGRWQEAFQAGTAALKHNPWDAGTLVLLAKAAEQLSHQECQLYYLRWALNVDSNDTNVNREAARALASLGHFEQAIACWKRVAQAKPGDQEAEKAIARLSVDQTIKKGGYDQGLLSPQGSEAEPVETSVAALSTPSRAPTPSASADTQEEPTDEQRLLEAVESEPEEIDNYVELAEWYGRHDRLPDAERVLVRALSASGGALHVRELLEDAQLRRIRQQVEIAQARAERESSEEATALAQRMEAQANQSELEIYAARTAREPGNVALQFEFGLRLKRAKKYREAIQAFQAARDDSRRKAMVHIHLGECFQHIQQFKLAAGSYETAVQASEELDQQTKKLALYRAGVLATELKDRERAEKHLTELAAIDFGYRDVADRLDKLATLGDSV